VKPKVGITMGDPCGIGPEVIVKALCRDEIYEACVPIVIGDLRVMERDLRFADKPLKLAAVEEKEIPALEGRSGEIFILDLSNADPSILRYGELSPLAGAAAVEYIERAVELAMRGVLDAVTTGPVNKAAINLAGKKFTGHTELLAELTGVEEATMMLAGEKLRVSFVTTHLPLKEVPRMITEGRVLLTVRRTDEGLRMMGFERPSIAVAALNPHAGEGGVFGREEIEAIEPAIKRARDEGIDVEGPFPADTLFFRAVRGEWDGVVAMYHDQGGIPIKTVEFRETVNITLGLPIVRTSVGHGTAFDIAGKGVADGTNMAAAVLMAARLASNKVNRLS